MNLPILQSEVKTMSSIDLLELINNVRVANNEEPLRRNSFNLKIEDELEGSHYTKNVVKNQNGTESVVYELTIEQCTLIGMRESKSVRRTVLEKLKQLENHIQLPNFTDPAEAAIAWAKEYREKQALAIENQTLKPKAEQWQRFIDTDGLLPSRTIGKLLGFKSAQEFNKAIKEKRVAFKADDGTWQFYADFKDKEIGKMVAWEKGEYNKAGTQLKWHTRAVEYFANLFNRQVQGGI